MLSYSTIRGHLNFKKSNSFLTLYYTKKYFICIKDDKKEKHVNSGIRMGSFFNLIIPEWGIFSKQDVKFQIQKEEKFTIKNLKRSYKTDKLGKIYSGNNRRQFLSLWS